MKQITIQPLPKKIDARVTVPGCLSYTIRALNIAAMTKGPVKIINPAKSDDTYTMINILKTLGITVKETADSFLVQGSIADVKEKDYRLNVNISGRTARTVLALLTIVPGTKTVTCDEGFKKRPVKDLVEGLRQLGAKIEYLEEVGFLPVKITSNKLNSGTVKMRGEISSQYFSAIMMIAPKVGEIIIEVLGDQSSKPFIDVTIETMKDFGVEVINHNYKKYLIKEGQKYHKDEYIVEADAIAASYFWGIAAITGNKIIVKNLSPHSKQGDVNFSDILQTMGCKVTKNADENWIAVEGTQTLKGITIDMNANPDTVPTLAVVAAFAKGTTTISGIGHLKVKESDRIEAPKKELTKMGILAESTESTITIHGGNPQGSVIETYGDHRMAMAFTMAGKKIPGIKINNPMVVNKSFPKFWETLEEIGMKNEKNIAFIGLRGSGKSTLAPLLAKKLKKDFVDMDILLVEKIGIPVNEIVETYGWDYFRNEEEKMTKRIAKRKNIVIATGGGIVLREKNIEVLKKNSIVIFLKAPIETLIERIGDDTKRAPLTDKKTPKEEMEEVWNERKELYERAADYTINTEWKSSDEIIEEVIKLL
jgi:3-phosphoshikimate 1-carboxyvinyltransferase